MASFFCPHCGSKAEYKFAAPNFCYKCGLAYEGFSSAVQKHKKTSKLLRGNFTEENLDNENEEQEEDDEEGYFSNSTRVPRISKISVEIDASSDVRVIKFSNLMSSNYETSAFPKGKTQNLSDLSDD